MQKNTTLVIWITGASSGIGRALATAYSALGHRIIISARNVKELEITKQLCLHKINVTVLPLDLCDSSYLPNKVSEAIAIYGRIDILINNAGLSQRSLIADTAISVYKKLMDVNYLGTIALSKALLPYFVNQKSGHYVTVTSLMGRFGSPYRSGYCAAKHGLHGFFDVLRMEHAKDHIKVTMVCPGFVKTKVAQNALTKDGNPQLTDDVATQNGLAPSVCAHRIVRAVKRKKFEVYIGRKEVLGIYLKRFFPRLLHYFVLRSAVK